MTGGLRVNLLLVLGQFRIYTVGNFKFIHLPEIYIGLETQLESSILRLLRDEFFDQHHPFDVS